MGGDSSGGSGGRVAGVGDVELFLIAHKVRGEAAWDVATRMECPECAIQFDDGVCDSPGCAECDGIGFWWIIPTSGHRAYPAVTWRLSHLYDDPEFQVSVLDVPMPIMDGLPDHYPTRSAPTINAMEALLGSIAPARGGFRRIR